MSNREIFEESKNALLSKDSRISQFIKPFIDGDNVTKIVNSDNEYYNSCKALENLLRWSYDVSPYLCNKIFRKRSCK